MVKQFTIDKISSLLYSFELDELKSIYLALSNLLEEGNNVRSRTIKNGTTGHDSGGR